jgi:dihydrofolate synthase / folylpolyglutamate synthase
MKGYSAALEYLYSLEKFGIVFGLHNVYWLLSLIGNPHTFLKTVHVGGTNGKGSVVRMVSGALTEAGYRVGRYTSPHLVSFTERIAINNAEITEQEIVRLTTRLKKSVDATDPSHHFTFFDFTTALAFDYFREQAVDVAVVEVGLGGRLDSTNVLNPLVSVITNVEMDHMDYLGNSIEDIAREKAGILKEGVPAVTGAMGTPLRILRESARGKCPFLVLDESFSFEKTGDQEMAYRGLDWSIPHLHVNLAGDHQLLNGAVALCTLELLVRSGFAVSDSTAITAFAKVSWPGRLELAKERPVILLDAAHNVHGAQALASYLRSHYSGRKKILVFGVMKDKEFPSMLGELLPLFDTIVLTKPDTARAASPHDLKVLANHALIAGSVREALQKTRETATENDVIVITGSFYTVGEARGLVDQIFQ